MKYHIWTEGCQMNVADSQRVASALERLGYQSTALPEAADVIVLNTCVVRQSAEEKAYGRLSSLRPLKERRPGLVINVMGCLVGVKGNPKLQARFPYVDVFSAPSDPGPLLAFLTQSETRDLLKAEVDERFDLVDEVTVAGEDLKLPAEESGKLVAAHIPIVYGCSHACTFCVIPFRRGIERSRPLEEILSEARALAAQGVREITLLGQIVDRYGKDAPDGPNLSGLLRRLHGVEGIERIRFLTSHPNWMTGELLDTVAELPKVCPHIEVPVQAGDDEVLANMHRGYTSDDYRQLVGRIRERIPGVSVATDIIVGFPGETDQQFQHTFDLLAELKLDVAHLARYSSRPGTVATRRMDDNISDDEKMRRFRLLEELQEGIAAEIHARKLGERIPVLFEEKVRGRWRGRTPNNELVFTESEDNLHGETRPVAITWTGPWSMQATLSS
ncbi:MAG TPA: tRNA (N6-isopentenyl adenosine(37)-C2)-methylthiotransferase MiaB [Anaerolineaceae bacterium]